MRLRSPLERPLLIVLATLAMFCGSPLSSWALPPQAVNLQLELQATNGERCHGTPVGLVQILTADHCVGSGVVEWKGQHIIGMASLLWRDSKRDIAMLRTEEPQAWQVVSISKDEPKPLDVLFWRIYVWDMVSVATQGHYLGLDDDKQMVIDGMVVPGASGSGVVDQTGKLVGVVLGSWHPLGAGNPRAALFPNAMIAVPIKGWPKP